MPLSRGAASVELQHPHRHSKNSALSEQESRADIILGSEHTLKSTAAAPAAAAAGELEGGEKPGATAKQNYSLDQIIRGVTTHKYTFPLFSKHFRIV